MRTKIGGVTVFWRMYKNIRGDKKARAPSCERVAVLFAADDIRPFDNNPGPTKGAPNPDEL